MGGWLGGMGGWLGRKTWHFFRFLARRYAPAPKIEKNALKMAAEFRPKFRRKIPPKIPRIRKWLRKLLVIGVIVNPAVHKTFGPIKLFGTIN